MEENNLDQLKKRKEELETTLKNLAELMASRKNLLYYYEKNVFKKITDHMFSNLNVGSKGSTMSGLYLIKKNYELDLMLLRRGQFYLHKRKRTLIEELAFVDETLQSIQSNVSSVQVDSTDPSLSA